MRAKELLGLLVFEDAVEAVEMAVLVDVAMEVKVVVQFEKEFDDPGISVKDLIYTTIKISVNFKHEL